MQLGDESVSLIRDNDNFGDNGGILGRKCWSAGSMLGKIATRRLAREKKSGETCVEIE